jgi:Ca2+-binding EF-hand superfamily protein
MRCRAIFNVYDIDRDNDIGARDLLDLIKGVPKECAIHEELQKMSEEYIGT